MRELFKSSEAKLTFAALVLSALIPLSNGGHGMNDGEVKLHQERELIDADRHEDNSFFFKYVDAKGSEPPLYEEDAVDSVGEENLLRRDNR